METKSRYEVIADLENNKRGLIREREALQNDVIEREKSIKNVKRQLEDMEEDLKVFVSSLDTKKQTINELIKSVDDSLQRFASLQKKE